MTNDNENLPTDKLGEYTDRTFLLIKTLIGHASDRTAYAPFFLIDAGSLRERSRSTGNAPGASTNTNGGSAGSMTTAAWARRPGMHAVEKSKCSGSRYYASLLRKSSQGAPSPSNPSPFKTFPSASPTTGLEQGPASCPAGFLPSNWGRSRSLEGVEIGSGEQGVGIGGEEAGGRGARRDGKNRGEWPGFPRTPSAGAGNDTIQALFFGRVGSV